LRQNSRTPTEGGHHEWSDGAEIRVGHHRTVHVWVRGIRGLCAQRANNGLRGTDAHLHVPGTSADRRPSATCCPAEAFLELATTFTERFANAMLTVYCSLLMWYAERQHQMDDLRPYDAVHLVKPSLILSNTHVITEPAREIGCRNRWHTSHLSSRF